LNFNSKLYFLEKVHGGNPDKFNKKPNEQKRIKEKKKKCKRNVKEKQRKRKEKGRRRRNLRDGLWGIGSYCFEKGGGPSPKQKLLF
jgi:hypothetical protein